VCLIAVDAIVAGALPASPDRFHRLATAAKGLLFFVLLVCQVSRRLSTRMPAASAACSRLPELYKLFAHSGERPRPHVWRDATGHEMDLVLEGEGDRIAIEVKSGQTVASNFFRGFF